MNMFKRECVRKLFATLIATYMLCLPMQVWAIACDAIFSNGIQATGATGNIGLSYHSNISGGTNILKSRTLSDSSAWPACSGATCTASGTAAPTSSPTFLTGNAANGNITLGYRDSGTYASGNYGVVSVGQEGVLKFNDNSGTYKTSGFTTALRSEVWLRSGDYWINGNLTLGQETILRRLSPSGTTRIFVNGNVSIGFQTATASFSSNQLLIYATGTINIGQQANLHAFVYAGGNLTFGFQTVVNGAVSGSNFIASGNEATVNYQPSAFSTANFEPLCGSSSSVSYYGITHSGTGVTCAAEAIVIRAYDSVGNAVAPAAGTQITLTTSPSTGSWMGGDSYSFTGTENSVTKYLQQTSAATLNINVNDGARSEISSLDPSITFAHSALKFYSDATGSAASAIMLNQVAGTVTGTGNNQPILKAIRTDTNTGACVAQTTGTRPVNLGYVCRNPTSCVAGQTFTVNGTNIQANANTNLANPGYLPVSLTFDSTGTASIPLRYSDVGQVRLFAQLNLSATGNNPAISLVGSSTDFVVRPYTLAVSSVTSPAGSANPGGTNGAFANSAFLAGGAPFYVTVEARNSLGQRTPNFGNELPYNTETNQNNIGLRNLSLVYPTVANGGIATALTVNTNFSATPPAGTFSNINVIWNQVGSFNVQPRLADDDYLGAGDITPTTSPTIGRFYPDRYILKPTSLVTNNCSSSPSLIYMGQPAASWAYTLEAQGVTGSVMTNYGVYGNPAARPYGVAENANDGTDRIARLSAAKAAIDTGVWALGIWSPTSPGASFDRAAAPDGPYNSLQLGLGVTDTFDSRSLSVKDMNASTTIVCSGASCSEIALSSPWDVRYGRLRLDDAFGPETFQLNVNFATEYWVGNRFVVNANDSCTLVPRTAIKYPAGFISVDTNRTVPLTGGSTVGVYPYPVTPSTGVGFQAGTAGHYFTSPAGGQGKFAVEVNLTTLPWLQFDWNQDGIYSDPSLPKATFEFGSYRGNDRVIYWREKLQ